MRTLATKQPAKDLSQQKQDRVRSPLTVSGVRSRNVSPLSTGIPLLQRKCACGGSCPRCQGDLTLQTKLKINEPGDEYEQEADRIADEVMRMPEPSVQQQVESEEENEEKIVQRQAIAPPNPHQPVPAGVPPIVHEVLSTTGQSLNANTRRFMEDRFGYNFSQVQVHTDAKAVESAQVLQARAFTLGHNIVFNRGQYEPETLSGKRLLAHELTHVLQQQQGLALIQRASLVSGSVAFQGCSSKDLDNYAVIPEEGNHPIHPPVSDTVYEADGILSRYHQPLTPEDASAWEWFKVSGPCELTVNCNDSPQFDLDCQGAGTVFGSLGAGWVTSVAAGPFIGTGAFLAGLAAPEVSRARSGWTNKWHNALSNNPFLSPQEE
jgi:Domain of unknown function (DUF4157)